MDRENAPIPFISRLFVGAFNEFETELVFAEKGCVSPREAHNFAELIVVVAGKVQITYENLDEPEFYEANSLIEVPAGTIHQLTSLSEENKLVIIHPDRSK
jgi:quercetin dioxygenase-like cupin family protein